MRDACRNGKSESVDTMLAMVTEGRKQRQEYRLSNPQSVHPVKPQDVSTFGTILRAAVEKEIDRQLSCGDCVGYLRKLNQQTEHDTAEIAQYLYANFQWPHEWREKIGDKHAQKLRITEIIETIVTAETPGG